MKILVTGGAGYIGGTLTRLLLAQGHSVTVYDNLCHSKRLAVAANADFVEGDIADRGLLEHDLAEAGEAIQYLQVATRPQPSSRGAAPG